MIATVSASPTWSAASRSARSSTRRRGSHVDPQRGHGWRIVWRRPVMALHTIAIPMSQLPHTSSYYELDNAAALLQHRQRWQTPTGYGHLRGPALGCQTTAEYLMT